MYVRTLQVLTLSGVNRQTENFSSLLIIKVVSLHFKNFMAQSNSTDCIIQSIPPVLEPILCCITEHQVMFYVLASEDEPPHPKATPKATVTAPKPSVTSRLGGRKITIQKPQEISIKSRLGPQGGIKRRLGLKTETLRKNSEYRVQAMS